MSRVLVCLPVLLSGGGTEVQVLGLVRVLLGAGYEVAVCCYYEHDEAMVALFRETGIRVIVMDLRRDRGLLALLKALWRLFARERPDIVHVQYLAPGLVPIIAARLAGVRTIFSTVHVAGSAAYGWRHKVLVRFAARRCTAFICVSQGAEEFWFGAGAVFDPGKARRGRRHFTIYNAVDVDRIREMGRREDGETGRWGDREVESGPMIGVVGRLAAQKGHSILLDAMVQLVKAVPNARLLIIGEGPERGALELQVTNYQLQRYVQFLGLRSQEEVFRLYGSMDVLAMPSLFEGFGLTAAEAMAAGLPVVGTRIEGLSEVIDDGVTGYLVPLGDSAALAGRLIELLSDPDKRRRMGQAGNERVKALFSMERFRKSMLAAYEYFRES